MKAVEVSLASSSPYSQSRYHDAPKLEKEHADDFERRTWRDRLHTTDDGEVYIPPMAIHKSLSEYAKYTGEKIKGKGQATWTKHFEAGLMIPDPILLGIKATDVKGEPLFLNADGKRGGGKRVLRYYPCIKSWSATFTIYILDETITVEKLTEYLEGAGKFIGIGRWRPRNQGMYGRFEVKGVKG